MLVGLSWRSVPACGQREQNEALKIRLGESQQMNSNIMHSDIPQITPYISVVIPVYNEEETLLELYRRLSAVLDELCKEARYEILFVDDGSNDRSFEILKSLHERHPEVRVLRFSRNFGHHVAITAGLDHARGRFVAMMDADLQDQPEFIPTLLE